MTPSATSASMVADALRPEVARHLLVPKAHFSGPFGSHRTFFSTVQSPLHKRVLHKGALVEDLIYAEEVGALALKGLARPVPTWSVDGLKPAGGRPS